MMKQYFSTFKRLNSIRLYSNSSSSNISQQSEISNSTLKSTNSKLSARERAKFTALSFKDIFEGFITNEESFDPIDTTPIFADPKKFVGLTTFHRDQVIQELEKRMKRNWNDISNDYKRTAYFISYGNWGVREDLSNNLYSNSIPEDLPFKIPSEVKNFHPKPSNIIKLLPPIDLMQISPTRKEEFKNMTRRLDPFTKTVVYLCIIISLLALWRDQLYGEEYYTDEIPESPLVLIELQRQKEQEELERLEIERKVKESNERLKGKKWYYLWLK
ncbi:hypothetical protein WICMUC_002907 [Wickerhamomyces mucosus]|uniref:Genetic interactor of prohibitin 7, mitochondrial n=1 Tax=Wickerhamomyces mucosus TaxID=1378264 RepID=A0A9P8PP58_9ASCO|nr:hypothetical protein WICMUC_002907 [Wickerhamomyces mucosus]